MFPTFYCVCSLLWPQAPTLCAAVQVVLLHNFLAKAANNEAKHIACHEDLWKCVYNFGSGEKYVPMAQSMPAFKELPAEAATMREGEYQKLFGSGSGETDLQEIRDFKRNLAWNLGEARVASGTIFFVLLVDRVGWSVRLPISSSSSLSSLYFVHEHMCMLLQRGCW